MTDKAPPIEEVMANLRKLLEGKGEFNAVILTNDPHLHLVPCDRLPPRETLDVLLIMKSLGMMNPGWALVASDSYHYSGTDKEDMKALRRGSLKEMFEAGDERVSECLMATFYSKTRRFSAMQPYVRAGDGVFIYDDVITVDDGSEEANHFGGDLPERLKKLVDHVG